MVAVKSPLLMVMSTMEDGLYDAIMTSIQKIDQTDDPLGSNWCCSGYWRRIRSRRRY